MRAIERMDELFAIDAQARDEKMDHAARHALRQQQAPPLLDQIRDHVRAMNGNALPQSAAGKACSYALTLWKRLTCFLDHPELELSNNLAENSMRPVATGRKNWIHIGSQQAGPRVAAILSVIESCRRMKIPVRDYLGDILPDSPIHPSSASSNSHLPPGQPTISNFQPRGWNRPYSSSQPSAAEQLWLPTRLPAGSAE